MGGRRVCTRCKPPPIHANKDGKGLLDGGGEGGHSQLLKDDALGVGAAGEGLLPLRAKVSLVEILVRPALLTAQVAQLTTGSKTTSLTARVRERKGEGEDCDVSRWACIG